MSARMLTSSVDRLCGQGEWPTKAMFGTTSAQFTSRGGRQALSGQSPRTSSVHVASCLKTRVESLLCCHYLSPGVNCSDTKTFGMDELGRCNAVPVAMRKLGVRRAFFRRLLPPCADSNLRSLVVVGATLNFFLIATGRTPELQKRASSASLLDCDNQ
jgi:hypothetical protein